MKVYKEEGCDIGTIIDMKTKERKVVTYQKLKFSLAIQDRYEFLKFSKVLATFFLNGDAELLFQVSQPPPFSHFLYIFFIWLSYTVKQKDNMKENCYL